MKKVVIGVDFGAHHLSLSLWSEDTGFVEVFANDMGYRYIPCVVAFRKDEILVGQTAQVQKHKNATNTFDNIRSMLCNSEVNIFVPLLDKEISSIELASVRM
jgi:molecular chaperone DnaK (HSP70)